MQGQGVREREIARYYSAEFCTRTSVIETQFERYKHRLESGKVHEKEREKESNTNGERYFAFVSKQRIVHRVGACRLDKFKTKCTSANNQQII